MPVSTSAPAAPPSRIEPPPPLYTPKWVAPKPALGLREQITLRLGHLGHLRNASQGALKSAIVDAWSRGNSSDATLLQDHFLSRATLQDGLAALHIGQTALRARAHAACLPALELALAAGALNTPMALQAMAYAYVSVGKLGAARALLATAGNQRGLDAVLKNELANVELLDALAQADPGLFLALQQRAISLYQAAARQRPQSRIIAQNLRVAKTIAYGPRYGTPEALLPRLCVTDGTAVHAAILTGLRGYQSVLDLAGAPLNFSSPNSTAPSAGTPAYLRRPESNTAMIQRLLAL